MKNEVCVSRSASAEARERAYEHVYQSVATILDGESDWVAAMATTVCELHAAFDYFDWTGFYRHAEPELLVIGPYQGSHGCLRIPFARGVCGAAARERRTVLVPNVHEFPGHIACASSTESEIVVPVLSPAGKLLAVLDVDSDDPAAFSTVDQAGLERICDWLGRQYG